MPEDTRFALAVIWLVICFAAPLSLFFDGRYGREHVGDAPLMCSSQALCGPYDGLEKDAP